jgi:hypothetical protein
MKPPTHHKMVQKRHQEEISRSSDSTEAAATATELRALKRTRFQSSKAAKNELQRSLKDIPFQPPKSSKLTSLLTLILSVANGGARYACPTVQGVHPCNSYS